MVNILLYAFVTYRPQINGLLTYGHLSWAWRF